MHKLTIRHWVKHHLDVLLGKPVILFTVSGFDFMVRSTIEPVVESVRRLQDH